MRRATVTMLAVLGILIVTGSGAALAQSESYQATEVSSGAATSSVITGTLVSRTATSLVIKTDDGVEMTFTLDQGAAIPQNAKSGDRLTLEYQSQGGGAFLASHVTLETLGKEAPATASDPQAGKDKNMPRTASPLPLMALIGTLMLGVGAGLRKLSRHNA